MNDIHPADNQAAGLAALRAELAGNPGAVLEMLAATHGVSLQTVTENLPAACRAMAAGIHAEAVMHEIATWGPVTVLVHTGDIILECKGTLPDGSFARGYYNLAHGGPLGGHFRLDHCAAIAFVQRPFMGSESCSVSFFNGTGEAMFKIFVGRDEQRQLLSDQVERFKVLQSRLCH